MLINADARSGLEILSGFPEKSFIKLINITFAVLSNTKGAEEETILQSIEDIDHLDLKIAYAGLVTFILEAARNDTSSTSLKIILKELDFSQDFIKSFTAVYSSNKSQIRQILSSKSNIEHQKIVGFDWRLDYKLRCSTTGTELDALYSITFKIQKPDGNLRDLTMNCNWTQLQDLLWRFQDANKQIERLTGITTKHYNLKK